VDTELMMIKKDMIVTGLMSGTSLDGLDICTVKFDATGAWDILDFYCETYTDQWRRKLGGARDLNGLDLTRLHVEFGRFQAEAVKDRMMVAGIRPDAVAAHGHTVFHQPEQGFSLQIGDGETMTAILDIPVITNFRMQDIALGGQGAPLVPAGEVALFPAYDIFLNLGGFANIHVKGEFACDITVCNMALNYLAATVGLDFDPDGKLASSGSPNTDLIEALNHLPFFQRQPPKSLGAEWFIAEFLPVLQAYEHIPPEDRMRSVILHLVLQTRKILGGHQSRILVTGGGALNTFLIGELRRILTDIEFVVPDKILLDGKEALVFAWLGYRRLLGLDNTRHELTGANKSVSGGSLHGVWV
jgi:anhydro-N-acetylmuramic acid kinase